MSNDADLIRKMIETWYGGDETADFVEEATTKYAEDMARVLAVVRAHDAGPARRVPVQIVVEASEGSPSIICLASDHTLHQGWWESGKFAWREALPPFPQPGDGA